MGKSIFAKSVVAIAVVIAIIFSLGGAFNVGETRFWMATPFMALLIILSFRSSQKYCRALPIVFITACMAISMTLYKNPWVFPILQEGTQVEVLKDSFYERFSDGSGFFVEANDIYISVPSAEQQSRLDSFLQDDDAFSIRLDDAISGIGSEAVYRLKAGQRFPVLGAYNFGGIDSENRNYAVTALGHMSEDEIQEGNIRIVPDLPIQSQWSKYLGNLMYWPILALLAQSYVTELFLGSTFKSPFFMR